jgi:RNA chaperone Hfq
MEGCEKEMTGAEGEPQGKVRHNGPNFLKRLVGRQVTVWLTTGSSIGGMVEGYNRYELLIRSSVCGSQLVFKHAIEQIVPDDDDAFTRKESQKPEPEGDDRGA